MEKQTPKTSFISPPVPKNHENGVENASKILSPSQASVSISGMDGIDLGPPIATLRSLKVLATHGDLHDQHKPAPKRNRLFSFDPVRQGLLGVKDAQKAIDMYYIE